MPRSSAKAAVFFGPGKPFELREVPIPEVEPEGVLIRVTRANICGSDLHFWRGDAPLKYPEDGWLFGHEMTGVLVQQMASGLEVIVGAINVGLAWRLAARLTRSHAAAALASVFLPS